MSLDVGLLILRVGAGGLMMVHGIGKVADLFGGRDDFFDPFGFGPVPSLALAAFAECLCALAVLLGFKTRWAAVPVVITMLIAAFMYHADDSFYGKEKSLLFAVCFTALLFTGGGKYSLDALYPRRVLRR